MYFESSVVNHSEWFQPKSVPTKLLSMLPGQIDCMDWEVEDEKISTDVPAMTVVTSDTLKHPGPAKSKTFMTRPAYVDLEAFGLTELPPVQAVFREQSPGTGQLSKLEAASAASWPAPALAVPDLGSRNHARLWGDVPEKNCLDQWTAYQV